MLHVGAKIAVQIRVTTYLFFLLKIFLKKFSKISVKPLYAITHQALAQKKYF